MKYYYILKDGKIEARTPNRENALQIVRDYQQLEKHPILRANFSIIYGEESIIDYKN